jgi:hypothetical protein
LKSLQGNQFKETLAQDFRPLVFSSTIPSKSLIHALITINVPLILEMGDFMFFPN